MLFTFCMLFFFCFNTFKGDLSIILGHCMSQIVALWSCSNWSVEVRSVTRFQGAPRTNKTLVMYWCMLLAYIRGLSVLAPSGMFLFMRGIHGSCWLFISHCFQAWIALFIFVSWVSVNGTGTPPSTSRDSPSDKDIFFLPHRLQAPGVMKTKYAHLPLAVLFNAFFSLLFLFYPLSTRSWHLGQWELCLCLAVVRRDVR